MNLYKPGFFTGMYDSDGAPIHVGDTVEYFQSTYAFNEEFRESRPEETISEYKQEAENLGFTVFRLDYTYLKNSHIRQWYWSAYKPCVGVVQWNDYACTFEPLIDSPNDYRLNCFRFLINNYKDDNDAYCRVIKKWNEKLIITAQTEKP